MKKAMRSNVFEDYGEEMEDEIENQQEEMELDSNMQNEQNMQFDPSRPAEGQSQQEAHEIFV